MSKPEITNPFDPNFDHSKCYAWCGNEFCPSAPADPDEELDDIEDEEDEYDNIEDEEE